MNGHGRTVAEIHVEIIAQDDCESLLNTATYEWIWLNSQS